MSRIAAIRAAARGASAPVKAGEDSPETQTPDDGTPPPDQSTRKEDDMAEADQNTAVDAARKEGHDAGFKAATDRLNAVKAHDNYAGREASALDLLGNAELLDMSAEGIGGLLGGMRKTETAGITEDQQREAAEEGGRKEMREALAGSRNSNIDADAGNGGGKDKSAASAAVWDEAIAAVCPAARA